MGFAEEKEAHREGEEIRAGAGTAQTQSRESGGESMEKKKNCSVTFPNILFGS